ncbi:5-methylcytosine restriction system specificity protein McrC [Christiangramia sabulilitoris]|uniref:Restriction endonuclease n=1 Tax=Christiangramia sabulilitoris TaxID=2583991 RepID=A0A550I7K8_9FLAO|nr:restriction endonuclease [Christiangramia sabulilitoris]TRO66955.1 restriction endonuclease [Christiangramia sabulilitoris]
MYCAKTRLISTYEHCNAGIVLPKEIFQDQWSFREDFPKKKEDGFCFELNRTEEKNALLKTGYFIGVDHIGETGQSIYVAPKFNDRPNPEAVGETDSLKEVDFLKMLFESLQNPELLEDIEELFVIKWDKPEIHLEHQKDFLTPFLILQFLGQLKSIVRKGIKKSYYKVERNLNSRVKGKILIGKTLKQNHFKSRELSNVCSYEEFGVNGIENRFLKKILEFVKPYLESHSNLISEQNLLDIYNFINPAFSKVSSKIEIQELQKVKTNAFYKEYTMAIDLGQKILKRFGHNISQNSARVEFQSTPPFWIDMSKLFEVYVLGKLRKELDKKVEFQFDGKGGNELDYVISYGKDVIIADAKYKPWYKYDWNEKMNDDLRQVSGYARLKEVRNKFKINDDVVPNCLIIYPDLDDGHKNFKAEYLSKKRFDHYKNIYKVGITIPLQERNNN